MNINKQNCPVRQQKNPDQGVYIEEILPGEIPGVSCHYLEIGPSVSYHLEAKKDHADILICFEGTGTIAQHDKEHVIREKAVFVPEPGSFSKLSGGNAHSLHILQLTFEFTKADMKFLEGRREKLPWFLPYSESPSYREKIKSPRTISRTLVPEDILPRFCLGSVETTGPDEVARHEHPGLEQLFFGLAHNDVSVTADDAIIPFKAFDLLHIPLGSTHGVNVEEGKVLHYIWVDFFKTQEGIKHIADNHIPEAL